MVTFDAVDSTYMPCAPFPEESLSYFPILHWVTVVEEPVMRMPLAAKPLMFSAVTVWPGPDSTSPSAPAPAEVPLIVLPLPEMLTLADIAGSSDRGVMVRVDVKVMVWVIMLGNWLFTEVMAARKEPVPVSLLLVTSKLAAPAAGWSSAQTHPDTPIHTPSPRDCIDRISLSCPNTGVGPISLTCYYHTIFFIKMGAEERKRRKNRDYWSHHLPGRIMSGMDILSRNLLVAF